MVELTICRDDADREALEDGRATIVDEVANRPEATSAPMPAIASAITPARISKRIGLQAGSNASGPASALTRQAFGLRGAGGGRRRASLVPPRVPATTVYANAAALPLSDSGNIGAGDAVGRQPTESRLGLVGVDGH